MCEPHVERVVGLSFGVGGLARCAGRQQVLGVVGGGTHTIHTFLAAQPLTLLRTYSPTCFPACPSAPPPAPPPHTHTTCC
jgi:hypothetical protein